MTPRSEHLAPRFSVVVQAGIAGLLLLATVVASSAGLDAVASSSKGASRAQAARGSNLFRFAVIGDQGQFTRQMDVARLLCREHARLPFNPIMTAGDNVGPNGHPRHFQEKFFKPYKCLFDRGVKFHATLGNHDFHTNRGLGMINEPRFGMPARNYVLRMKGVRFVVWDSNTLDMGWLRKATVAQSGDRWTIVIFHHPLVSGGPRGGRIAKGALRNVLPRLLSQRGVDLVFSGSHHIYSVSRSIGGVRYVVTGGGSGSADTCRPDPEIQFCERRLHFMRVAAGSRYLWVREVATDGPPVAPEHSFRVAPNR
jgi:Calcineurin-like phosphoesterase